MKKDSPGDRERERERERKCKKRGKEKKRWKEKRNVWAKYFLPVIILSIILTLPILVEFDFANEADPKMDSIIRSSSERLHPLYSVFYVGVLNLGILGVSPTAYLTYIACQIRRELKKSDAMLRHFAVRRSITKRKKRRTDRNDDEKGQNDQITISLEDDQNKNRTTRSEMEIKALKAIARSIFVFIVFHSFRITTTLGELYIVLYSNKDGEAFENGNGMPYWFESIASLSDFFMVLNASIDGIIYINLDLETKIWIPKDEQRKILNTITEILNSWKKNTNPKELYLNENLSYEIEFVGLF